MFIRIYTIFFLLLALPARSGAQEVLIVKQATGSDKEVLFLSHPSTDSSLRNRGTVKTSSKKKGSDFISQVNNLALETVKAGGNIFLITEIKDRKQSGKYKIRGKAFYSGEYERVKAGAIEASKGKLQNGKYATLIVYRPVYNEGYNDEVTCNLLVNDTMKLEMKGNTKYIIKVFRDCNLKISDADKKVVQHIQVQVGNSYYVRAYTNFPGLHKHLKVGEVEVRMHGYEPYFELIDSVQGDLESGLVNSITISSKKIN